MKNGSTVAAFEQAFAEYVGAKYAIALCNGTATLHTALAVTLKHGAPVAVPPLTMSATTIAALHAGCRVVFADIDPRTWLMRAPDSTTPRMGVSLYGLHHPGFLAVDDAAQTLRAHGDTVFTSYSFQASKILPLGEGGMLVTNIDALAENARSFSSLGYDMRADQPRIDPAVLKHPTYERHHRMGWNYRMNDATAYDGLCYLRGSWNDTYALTMPHVDGLKRERLSCAAFYRDAVAGCDWITPQHVPEGWQHDMWTYAVALASADLWEPFTAAVVAHGGEMPYGAWRLTYHEPAFRHLAPSPGTCPVAEDLQPRLVQFQTNNLQSAERNAAAVARAIKDIGGSR
jgi:perosamine synthetase